MFSCQWAVCATIPGLLPACQAVSDQAVPPPAALQQSGWRCNSAAVVCACAVMSWPEDVAEQQRGIGPANQGQFVYPGYAHMDFVW